MVEGGTNPPEDRKTPDLIDIADLEYTTEGVSILRGISVTASEKRIGIVGRNGSGKSTLARVLCGLIPPSAGRVRIAGIDIARDRKQAIRTVGMLFQNPDHQIIFPTVEEEIGFGLIQLGFSKPEAGQHTRDILGRFGKTHWAETAIEHLSQGQRHLVCLMAVLAMQPKVIILDEPYSGLDIPTTRQLARYLDQVDAALVHISHDPVTLAGYDRVLWMEGGQIEMDGPAAPTLAAFVARMEQLGEDDDLAHLPG